MNNNKILIGAIAASMALPGVALAAIDDSGMAYVSASEGLSGRIQVRWTDTDENDRDGTISADAVRLYLKGDLDIGGGMKSTYGAELRLTKAGSAGLLNSYHVGLSGAFGSLDFGKINGVTDSGLVPGGSLDTVAGSSAEWPYPHKSGNDMRYISPSLNGLKFGFGVKVSGADDDGVDGSFDAYDAAIHYTHPIGVSAGFGLQNVKEKGSGNADQEGWLLGATYSQAGWTVAYGYRTFEAFDGFDSSVTNVSVVGTGTVAVTSQVGLDFAHANAEYNVHRFAAKFNLDRVTASVNYSKEESSSPQLVKTVTTSDGANSNPTNAYAAVTNVVDAERTTLGADVAYALGSKSRVALGFKNVETTNPVLVGSAFVARSKEVDTIIIDYQVNF